MKKKLFLRLCLTMAVVLSTYSCRQDLLPEQETYNNSSAFQLISKRISLEEAKHKANLVSKIKQVETNLYTDSKNNLQGKTVNFGNGISIDTDDVIYLEKGPDFHSYTFRIDHENAPVNAPVENLVISSRPDGTWKEVLVTYYLTPQERQNMLSGGAVDFTGKITHEILQNGTYSSAIMQQDVMNCHMEISTYYTRCGESDDHHQGELTGTAGPCRSDTPSVLVVSLVKKCTMALPADTGLGENGEGGGSGPGGLGSNPPDETTTAPNLPNLANNPCRKTNASINAANNVLKNPNVQSQMDAVLKGKTQAPNEWGVAIGQASNGYEVTNAVEGIPGQNQVSSPVSQLTTPFIGDGHSHKGARGNPSGGDLYEMIKATLDHPGLTYRFVYGHNGGVPEVYALVINNVALAQDFLTQYPENENCNNTNNDHSIKEGSPVGKEFYKAKNHYSEGRVEDTSGENYEERTVGMAYILEKFNVGISIAKVDANGNLKKINASVEKITISNSGGAVKEGVKVSKCP